MLYVIRTFSSDISQVACKSQFDAREWTCLYTSGVKMSKGKRNEAVELIKAAEIWDRGEKWSRPQMKIT